MRVFDVNTKDSEILSIRQFTFVDWSSNGNYPSSTTAMVEFVKVLLNAKKNVR